MHQVNNGIRGDCSKTYSSWIVTQYQNLLHSLHCLLNTDYLPSTALLCSISLYLIFHAIKIQHVNKPSDDVTILNNGHFHCISNFLERFIILHVIFDHLRSFFNLVILTYSGALSYFFPRSVFISKLIKLFLQYLSILCCSI